MNNSFRNRTAPEDRDSRMTIMKKMILLLVLLACSFGTAFAHMGIDTSEFQARRQSVMSAASDGIVLPHSFSGPKSWSDSGFRQDSNFYYLTGLENLHDAILAVDGTTKESWLFVMAPTAREQRRFSGSVLNGWDSAYLAPIIRRNNFLGSSTSSRGKDSPISLSSAVKPIQRSGFIWTKAARAGW
jgi:hypothetical protein